jgi:hypothetical protein
MPHGTRLLVALGIGLLLILAVGCGPSREDMEASVQVVKSALEDCLQKMAGNRPKNKGAYTRCRCADQAFHLAFHPRDNRLYLLKNGAAVDSLILTVNGIDIRLSDEGGAFKVAADEN